MNSPNKKVLSEIETAEYIGMDQQRFSLKEISDKNVSNPTIRKGELMTRMRGTADIAKELGHVGSFVTLTCPSKYHCAYASSGDRNPNWCGATPYQAQQYLNQVWARIRAELARQEINIQGMRVAEPQHDGTPHWHMMLYMAPEQLAAFSAVVMKYALAEDGDEKGAKENRVKLVDIDPEKGSATGYIAKYISKNIDGQGLDADIDGGNATVALHSQTQLQRPKTPTVSGNLALIELGFHFRIKCKTQSTTMSLSFCAL